MGKQVTLLEQEESTMVSSWTCIISCRSTRGGWCILETHSESVDAPNEDDEEYDFYEDPYESTSEIIKTKEEFLAAWDKGCEVLCIDADIDGKVIAEVETICPKVAKALRIGSDLPSGLEPTMVENLKAQEGVYDQLLGRKISAEDIHALEIDRPREKWEDE